MIAPLPAVGTSLPSILDPSAANANANAINEVDEHQGDLFKSLLKLGAEKQGAVSPEEMLVNQVGLMGIGVKIDYTAKIAGSVGQAINKIVNIS